MILNRTLLTKTWAVCLISLICCLLWGSAFPCIKIGYELFSIGSGETASQILFAGIRFSLAGVMTALIGSVLEKRILVPKKESITKIITLSLFQTIGQYVFFYIGLAYSTGSKSSIISGTGTFIAILVSCFIFRQERFNARKAFGCIAGFAGIIIINLSPAMQLSFSIGDFFILISAVSAAFSVAFIKKYSQFENPVVLSGYQFFVGGIIMTIVGLVFGGKMSFGGAKSVALLIYMGMISAVAYSLWGILLKFNPVSKVTIFKFMIPVFGVTLSSLLIRGESASLGPTTIVALILVCAGIVSVSRTNKQ